MPSTYSTNLKIELMATGENSGTWGNITNTNLGTTLEQAVVGYGLVEYLSDANLTITLTNSSAAQAARALVLNVTSVLSLTVTRELVVPTFEKQYIVQNNTTGGQSITVKTSAGTGITVPNGRKAHLYVDGTNVIQMFDFVDINAGTIDGTPVGASAASTGAFTTLTASGATTLNGSVALGDAAVDLVTVPGTINSNLLFTDNSFDIGASGATRPRNLFLAGNGTIGGTLGVTGLLTASGGVSGNITSSSVTITGGTINGTSIGATTASTGAFTTLTSSSTTTLNGTSIPSSATLVTTTASQTLTSKTLTNPVINGFTGDTSVINIGSGQLYKDASGNVGIGTSSPSLSGFGTNTSGVQVTATNAALRLNGNAGGDFYLVSGSGQHWLYATGAVPMSFWTNSTERMRIDSAGNVGIGTSSPAVRLHVSSTADAAQLRVVGSGSGVRAQLNTINDHGNWAWGIVGGETSGDGIIFTNEAKNLRIFTNATERMRIDSAGNVGIGTSSPSSFGRLAVAGNISTTTDNSFIGLNDGSENKLSLVKKAGIFPAIASASGAPIIFSQSSASSISSVSSETFTERARIDSAGNLGIGTSSPQTKIQATGSSAGAVLDVATVRNDSSDANSEVGIFFNPSNQATNIRGARISAINNGGNNVGLKFYTGTGATITSKMTLDFSGNVGIGTSSPAVSGLEISRATGVNPTAPAELRISTSTNGSDWSLTNAWGRISFYSADTNDNGPKNHWDISTIAQFTSGSSSVLSFASYPGNVRTERMRIDTDGNVLIGKTTATANGGDLQVSSGITFPATQVPKSDANTLDDYEEGTWTPVYQGISGSIGSTAYSVQRGRYTKVGRVVFATAEVELSNKGSWTSGVRFVGLPFTNTGATEICFGSVILGFVDFAAGELYCNPRSTGGNDTQMYIDKTKDNADREILGTAAVANNSVFFINMVYTTA